MRGPAARRRAGSDQGIGIRQHANVNTPKNRKSDMCLLFVCLLPCRTQSLAAQINRFEHWQRASFVSVRTVKAIENDFNVVHDALPAYYFYECREWLSTESLYSWQPRINT